MKKAEELHGLRVRQVQTLDMPDDPILLSAFESQWFGSVLLHWHP